MIGCFAHFLRCNCKFKRFVYRGQNYVHYLEILQCIDCGNLFHEPYLSLWGSILTPWRRLVRITKDIAVISNIVRERKHYKSVIKDYKLDVNSAASHNRKFLNRIAFEIVKKQIPIESLEILLASVVTEDDS